MAANDTTVSIEPECILVRAGETALDGDRAPALLEKILAATTQTPGRPVILELSQVPLMPSMSIGALMTIWKKLQDGKHRLILAGTQAAVRSTLAICRLDKYLEFADTEQEARLRLQPSAPPA